MHQLFRCVIRVLERYSVIKQLFCITNVLSVAHRQESLRRAVVLIIRGSLESGGYILGAPPPPESSHRKHSRLVLGSLLWRRKVRDDPGKIFQSRADDAVYDKIEVRRIRQGGQHTNYLSNPFLFRGLISSLFHASSSHRISPRLARKWSRLKCPALSPLKLACRLSFSSLRSE